jgi:NAD(P)-dependent dehydrogenase (short-subunit alcohol dehydrogenase family)
MGGLLNGRKALITGATGTIGRAISIALASEGAHVVASGRDKTRGAALVAEIEEAGGQAVFIAADLDGSPAASRGLAEEAALVLGSPVDILVNNAGIFPAANTCATDELTFDAVYGVNVKAPFFLTATVAPAMVAAGGGAIVNITAWVARLGLGGGTAYAASKGALETLTRAWAAEFGPGGIRVNAVAPSVIRASDAPADPGTVMMNGTPAGRVGTPESIARAVVYLASDDSLFVHGTVLDVDGGRLSTAVIALN